MIKHYIAAALLLFSMQAALNAETLYVTDRILLGLHQENNESSPIIKTLPSGTAVTVLKQSENFTRIQLSDGTQGWLSNHFLSKEKPSGAELAAISKQLTDAQQEIQKLKSELVSKEREIQVHRDDLSNAKSNIKELQKVLKDAGSAPPAITDNNEELNKAKEQIKQLEQQIATLQQPQPETTAAKPAPALPNEIETLQNQNREFEARIKAALANLQGETVPSAAELAAIRPSFPFWYWLLLIALLIVGVVAGVFTMDFLHRRKHGGFRI